MKHKLGHLHGLSAEYTLEYDWQFISFQGIPSIILPPNPLRSYMPCRSNMKVKYPDNLATLWPVLLYLFISLDLCTNKNGRQIYQTEDRKEWFGGKLPSDRIGNIIKDVWLINKWCNLANAEGNVRDWWWVGLCLVRTECWAEKQHLTASTKESGSQGPSKSL